MLQLSNWLVSWSFAKSAIMISRTKLYVWFHLPGVIHSKPIGSFSVFSVSPTCDPGGSDKAKFLYS